MGKKFKVERLVVVGVCFFLSITLQNYSSFSQISLTDITFESGIDHSHISPLYMGGGVAFFDFNNDGLDDIYLTGGVADDKLYQNNGDLRFTDVTSAMGLKRVHDGHSMSVTIGDVDNDGYDDIFVTYGEKELSRLYKNENGTRFVDITDQSQIDSEAWAMGASLVDVNMDGYLDIYVINWVSEFDAILDEDGVAVGFNHTCYENNLYINNGDLTFTDLSVDYGVNNIGCGLAVLATDFNDDTYPDLYMANDFGEWVTENTIYQNEFPGTAFTNKSEEVGLNSKIYGMGIAQGDYNRDGYQDYYVTNIGPNVLLLNDGSYSFEDKADEAGVINDTFDGLNTTGWGAAFADLNNDGFEELLVANGFVPSADFIKTSEEDPNKIYQNKKDGTFADISEQLGIDTKDISRGVAISDLDNDGDLDILFTQLSTILSGKSAEENVYLYENKTVDQGNWLRIKLKGSDCGSNGFNTKLFIYSGGTKNYQIRELSSSSSHASQNTAVLHVGLGTDSKIDSLQVVWPTGQLFTFYGEEMNINRTYLIEQETAQIRSLGCTDVTALNFDPSAEVSFGCTYSTITAAEEQLKKDKIAFRMNLETQEAMVQLSTPASSTGKVFVTDLSGRRVYESQFLKGSDSFQFETLGWIPGVYILTLDNLQFQLKFFKR